LLYSLLIIYIEKNPDIEAQLAIMNKRNNKELEKILENEYQDSLKQPPTKSMKQQIVQKAQYEWYCLAKFISN